MSDEIKQPTQAQLAQHKDKKDAYGFVYFTNLANDHFEMAAQAAQRGFTFLKEINTKLAQAAYNQAKEYLND